MDGTTAGTAIAIGATAGKHSGHPQKFCGALVTDGPLERAKGIEPSYEAWEASVLPLNYARKPDVELRRFGKIARSFSK